MSITKIIYPIVHGFFYLLSLLPFRVLYALSDALYLLVYHVVRYRRKVVRSNLASSFPQKGESELREIERKFYHNLCDYFFETLKMLSFSPEEMKKHAVYHNVEEMQKCFDEGQSIAFIMGHYFNWEWVTSICLHLKHPEAVFGFVYHPLRNGVFDRLFIDMRSHLGGTCVPKQDLLRHLIKSKKEGKVFFTGYVSDQAPKWSNIHLWTPFLGHDTPVFTGGERLMRKMNDAVFYVHVKRTRRGHYIITPQLITRTPGKLDENAVTKKFFALLEANIQEDPSNYLWSHDRWKRTHEEFDRRYKVVNGRVIARSDSTDADS